MNPLWGGLTPEGLAGELVTAATNTSMYTYEIALASLIETAVLTECVNISGCRPLRDLDHGGFQREPRGACAPANPPGLRSRRI